MKELAAKYHTGQIWEGEVKRPYIVHPQGIVQKLLDWGELPSSTAIPMAWGHDLLEDTTVSEAEILAASNEVVLAGIKLLTKPQNMEKPLYLQRVADMASREILLVKTADRLFNSRSFATLR